MRDEHVEFLERFFIQQKLDTLSGGQACPGHAAASFAARRRLGELPRGASPSSFRIDSIAVPDAGAIRPRIVRQSGEHFKEIVFDRDFKQDEGNADSIAALRYWQ